MNEIMCAHADATMKALARPAALRHADAKVHTALEDKWLDEAYEAEAAKNPVRMRYIMGWVERLSRPV